jgi:chromosome segregation ATPase
VTAGQIAVTASLVVILTFFQDFLARIKTRKTQLTAEERARLREPLEAHGLILDNAKDAVALQSALLLDLRNDVDRLRGESAQKDAEIVRLKTENREHQRTAMSLYARIGKLTEKVSELEGPR